MEREILQLALEAISENTPEIAEHIEKILNVLNSPKKPQKALKKPDNLFLLLEQD